MKINKIDKKNINNRKLRQKNIIEDALNLSLVC